MFELSGVKSLLWCCAPYNCHLQSLLLVLIDSFLIFVKKKFLCLLRRLSGGRVVKFNICTLNHIVLLSLFLDLIGQSSCNGAMLSTVNVFKQFCPTEDFVLLRASNWSK